MKREHEEMNGDEGLEALLRHVGPRNEPSAEAAAEVRRAVYEEWRAAVARRRRQRRLAAFGLAASIALVVVVASWTWRAAAPVSNVAATIARVDGDARLQTGPADPTRTVAPGDPFAVGAVLSTDAATRVALAYGGASLRIDRDSTLERVSPDRFRLSAGAVYIDAHPQSRDRLVIETQAGEVHHLGTQYQIRQSNGVVEVSIREGRVQISRPVGAALASAGERLRISASGELAREAISAQDAAWDWAEATSPPFAIHDRPLAEFLEWAARETGRRVVYASPEAQRAAETLKLRGSIDGLDPDTALSAVLSTTELTRYESGEALIGVQLATDAD